MNDLELKELRDWANAHPQMRQASLVTKLLNEYAAAASRLFALEGEQLKPGPRPDHNPLDLPEGWMREEIEKLFKARQEEFIRQVGDELAKINELKGRKYTPPDDTPPQDGRDADDES